MAFNVVFLMFNRPALTEQVFARISVARPSRLLVVADGPRTDRPDDQENVAATRAVLGKVDWPCEVLTNFAETNLGCRRRVASGLDWALSQVDQAIILEDDCLPDQSFFPFCTALLDRYADDERIMHINGSNFQPWWRRYDASYYGTRYPQPWGWATWGRAWAKYDLTMSEWPAMRDSGWLERELDDPRDVAVWRDCFNDTYYQKNNTWDYAWIFACWRHHGLALTPAVNLVRNIGFGMAATHTTTDFGRLAPRVRSMRRIRHPPVIVRYVVADRYMLERILLLRASLPMRFIQMLSCRWTYGALLRRIPVLGRLWALWRAQR